MKISFRTTSGHKIGFGHLRRCLTLADALKERGVAALFNLSGEVRGLDIASDAGFVAELSHPIESRDAVALIADFSRGAHVLVLDDYALTDARGREIKAAIGHTKIVVIDDVAERSLDYADAIINPTVGLPVDVYPEARAKGVRLALGPRFAMLRSDFRHQAPRVVKPKVERVLLTLGGSDPTNLTPLIASDIIATLTDVRIDVVCGPMFGGATLRALADLSRVHPLLHVHAAGAPIYELMRSSDVALAAGGQTVFELASTGLATLAVSVADNQRVNLANMQRANTLIHVERHRVRRELEALAADYFTRKKMAEAGQSLVDGFGAVRAAELIAGL